MSVESAGVWEYPDPCPTNRFGLSPENGHGTREGPSVRRNPQKGDPAGAMPPDFAGEEACPEEQVVDAELVGPGSCSGDDIRQPVPCGEEQVALIGCQHVSGEARSVQCLPEAIAGSGEVTAECRGVQSGIDATEEDSEVGPDPVRQAAANGGPQLRLGGAGQAQ